MQFKSILITILLSSMAALAIEAAPDYSNNLSGDWSGKRLKLYNAGVDIALNYHVDFFDNLQGGLKRGAGILSYTNLAFSLDGKKLFNLDGSTAFIEFVSIPGARPNQKWVGSLVQVDNSEPGTSMTRLERAWIAQDLLDHKINILTGIYDVNTDFYLTQSASIFLQPSYGIGNAIAQTTSNDDKVYGTATFPNHALATRVKFTPNDHFYFQAALVDALLQNDNNINHLNMRISKHDGAMLIAETGVMTSYGNYSVGAWQFSQKFPLLLNPQVLKKNRGFYLMAEKSLYKQGKRELFGFVRYGVAAKNIVQIDQMRSIGLALNGVIAGRHDSQLGFAISRAHVSNDYVQATINNGQNTLSSETSYELTYSDKLLPWLTLQPDLQYIPRPALNPVNQGAPYLKTAVLAILRVSIAF